MLYFILSDIGIFSLDATRSYGSEFTNDVTQYPVESGFDVTKGVVKKSDTHTLSGIISDYHLKESFDFRSDNVVSQLKELKQQRSLVSLVAKTNVYDNLIITSISVSETSEGGHAKEISISFQEVRTASSTSTTVPREARPIITDSSDSKKNEGTQSKESREVQRGLINQILTPIAEPVISVFRG